MVLRSKLSLVSLTSFFVFFFFFFFHVATEEEFTYYSNMMDGEPAKFVFENFGHLYSFHRGTTRLSYPSTSWINVPKEGIVLKFIDSHRVNVGKELLDGSLAASRVVSMQEVGVDKTVCSMRLVKGCNFLGKELTLTFENDSTLEFKTVYDLPNDFTDSRWSQIVVVPPAGLAVGMYGFYVNDWRYYVSVESNSKAIFFYSVYSPKDRYRYIFFGLQLPRSEGSLFLGGHQRRLNNGILVFLSKRERFLFNYKILRTLFL